MSFPVRLEWSTASVGSSHAPTDAVDHSAPSAIRPESTYISGKVVQTNGATSDIGRMLEHAQGIDKIKTLSSKRQGVEIRLHNIQMPMVLQVLEACIDRPRRVERDNPGTCTQCHFGEPSCPTSSIQYPSTSQVDWRPACRLPETCRRNWVSRETIQLRAPKRPPLESKAGGIIRFLTRMYAQFEATAGRPCSDRGSGCSSLPS